MHDIDRVQLERDPEAEGFETTAFEGEWTGESGRVFDEAQEMELAAELLEIRDEAELDRFLGDFIKRAGQAVGSFVKSPTGQALGGILKGAAKKALPIVGGALGRLVGGESGANIGGQLASTAGRIFGLELEGLSGEDREYEVARGFVRFAGEAVKNAAMAPPSAPNPAAIAQSAVAAAARQFAPGLLRNGGPTLPGARPLGGVSGRSGRWIRRGSKIVLFGV